MIIKDIQVNEGIYSMSYTYVSTPPLDRPVCPYVDLRPYFDEIYSRLYNPRPEISQLLA